MVPTLYILMRNDLDSLNPGKAIAQASHATNQFELMATEEINQVVRNVVNDWRDNREFGRCLCVAATPQQIDEIMNIFDDGLTSFLGDVIVDPTYPIKDGEITHHLSLMTCGWVFVWDVLEPTWADEKVLQKIKKLSLYK